MIVYLLHFEPPYKQARHYLGCTNDLDSRLQAHQAGNGARLVEVALAAGHTFKLTRTWKGVSWNIEKRLKRHHNSPRLCPVCNPNAKHRATRKTLGKEQSR